MNDTTVNFNVICTTHGMILMHSRCHVCDTCNLTDNTWLICGARWQHIIIQLRLIIFAVSEGILSCVDRKVITAAIKASIHYSHPYSHRVPVAHLYLYYTGAGDKIVLVWKQRQRQTNSDYFGKRGEIIIRLVSSMRVCCALYITLLFRIYFHRKTLSQISNCKYTVNIDSLVWNLIVWCMNRLHREHQTKTAGK